MERQEKQESMELLLEMKEHLAETMNMVALLMEKVCILEHGLDDMLIRLAVKIDDSGYDQTLFMADDTVPEQETTVVAKEVKQPKKGKTEIEPVALPQEVATPPPVESPKKKSLFDKILKGEKTEEQKKREKMIADLEAEITALKISKSK